MTAPADIRTEIECRIARGWAFTRISADLGVPLLRVAKVSDQMDALSEADVFALTAPRSECCARGHARTPENLYTRGDGKRECLPCRALRTSVRFRRAA